MLLPGTYVGIGNRSIDFTGKAITVTSLAGPELTIIDAELAANGFFFQNGEGSGSVVSGLTIQNGQGVTGGNIKCVDSSPTITGCVLRWGRGEAGYGGAGIQCQGAASPVIELNSFIENLSPIGAGVACYGGASPTISQNVFTGNSTQEGGGLGSGAGIYCEYNSDPVITDNVFRENEGGFGGAILCKRNSNPVIDSNEIVGNSAEFGGGIFCDSSLPTISNNVLCDNVAAGGGGAIYCGVFVVKYFVSDLFKTNRHFPSVRPA
jgi:predicted outer membrane repeat protein